MSGPLELVRALLTSTLDPRIASLEALRAYGAGAPPDVIDAGAPPDTIDRAALGGLVAASVGWAFACGYQGALARLDPESTRGAQLTALCATEEGGAHPRAIRTTLTRTGDGGHTLSGRKAWVTLGTAAEVLLVVASTGLDAQGLNRLRVARVPTARRGVRVEGAEATPFAPEIGHARVVFEDVAVADAELLPGDGYDAVLKPFRTIEDAHVMAALVGWGIGVGRASAWEHAFLDEAVGVALLLRTLGAADPSRPETHVALAGAMAATRRLLEAAPWDRADAAVRAAWDRDRALLDVASRARTARLESAWRALRG
jgi:alkylation response protein AidB-like acyl-CoA dehydrogenase